MSPQQCFSVFRSPKVLVKIQTDFLGRGFCICNELPGDADAAGRGLGTTLSDPGACCIVSAGFIHLQGRCPAGRAREGARGGGCSTVSIAGTS